MTTPEVPFVDVNAQHRLLRSELDRAVSVVLEHGRFILGPEVERFEREFAAFVGTRCAIGVGCGLDALKLGLEAVGVGTGDEVILPANTFIATALAVSAVGARPVLVDVRKDTYHWDPSHVAAAITPRTKALLPVHLYGQACDMGPILSLARAHGLRIVEDACQAHGARWQGHRCGSVGDVGAFSFYPSKNLGALGDGGMVVTNDLDLADRIRRSRHYGQVVTYRHDDRGVNSRLDSLQAAALLVKLPQLEEWNHRRHAIARRYHELLSGCPELVLPDPPDPDGHVFHLFVIKARDRDGLRQHLASHRIATGIHYPVPLHLQPAYRDLGYGEGDFPVTELLAREILSLPMYPELEDHQVRHVAHSVRAFYR
jgi:dTDP-4-amino-4,6-dideoxygalactose transaminase